MTIHKMVALKLRRTLRERLRFSAWLLILRLLGRAERTLEGLRQALQYRIGLRYLYRPRPDDVFIATYPKSGTTLMQMMLYQLTTDGSMDFPHIDAVVPYFDRILAKGLIENLPSPRAFKTHRSIRELPKNAKIIFVARNPKDSCVSYFYHLVSAADERETIGEFTRRFVEGDVPLGSWYSHLEACLPYLGEKRVLFLSYDELRRDLPGVVERVASFCGVELGEDKKKRVVERCGLAWMKAHNHKFDPRLTTMNLDRQEVTFIRNGAVKGWVNELSPDLARLIDARSERLLTSLGAHESGTSGNYLSSVLSERSELRGAILAMIAGDSRDQIIWDPHAPGPDRAVVFDIDDELHRGERVRLLVESPNLPHLVACDAEVLARQPSGALDLKLTRVDAADVPLLLGLAHGVTTPSAPPATHPSRGA